MYDYLNHTSGENVSEPCPAKVRWKADKIAILQTIILTVKDSKIFIKKSKSRKQHKNNFN